MIQGIELTEWQTMFPKIGFALFFLAFAIIVWKATHMRKSDSDRSSQMPLDD